MKVVQINAVCEYGSTGRIVSEFSEYLSKEHIDNVIFYGNGFTENKNAYYIGSKFDHKLHAFFSRVSGMQGYFSRRATKKLVAKLKQYCPDIVHLHNLHGNFIHFPTLFHYLSKNPITTVVTLHDCFFYTGKCVHYTMVNCNRWQEKCGDCPQLSSGNASWFFDRTKKMLCDKKNWFSQISKLGVIGVSDWVTDEAKKSILSVASKFTTIYNWIDLDVFHPHATDIRTRLGIENKFIILGVAISWDETKGIQDYNRLAELLDDRFQIVLVGHCGVELNSKILHIERTSDIQMMSDLYAMADVFFNPSRRETFGKVTAEALACGTPAIVYNTTACPELVGDGCGYIEKNGDVDAVYQDILEMQKECRDYSKTCRTFAEKNFDKEKLLKQMLQFYKEIESD